MKSGRALRAVEMTSVCSTLIQRERESKIERERQREREREREREKEKEREMVLSVITSLLQLSREVRIPSI